MISLKQRWLVVSKYLSCFYLFWGFLGYVLGILVIPIAVIVLGLSVILIFRKHSILILLILLISFGYGHWRQEKIEEKDNKAKQNASELIKDNPKLEVKISGERAPIEGGYEYLGEIQGELSKNYGFLEFTLPRYPEYQHGDILELNGYFRKPANPEEIDFDYVAYLEKKEIFVTGKVHGAKKLSESFSFNDRFLRSTYDFKMNLTQEVSSKLPEPHASLLSGILFGVRTALPEEFSEQLRVTGTTHVVAISGYNMTIIIEFVKRYGKKFFGKASDFVAGIFVVWFGLMTGMSPPVERAVISTLQSIFGRKVGMKIENGPSLINSALVMLLIDPKLVSSISFLLSFGAVIGLIYWNPILKSIIRFIPESLEDGSIVTLSALIATLPISLYFFASFSVLALPTNFLIGPIVGITMTLGFIALFAGLFDFVLPIFDLVYYLCWVPLDIFINIVKFMDGFKFLYLSFEFVSKELIQFIAFSIVIAEIIVIFLFSPIKKESLPKYL